MAEITSKLLDKWEREGWKAMECDLEEYVPNEFWELLDAYRALCDRHARLCEWAEEQVSSYSGDENYLCPAGRAQIGLPPIKGIAD